MAQIIDGIEYLDVDEVVALLGVKKATLYAYVSRGVLQSYRQVIGRKRLYRRDEVERLCALRPSDEPESGKTSPSQSLPDAASWAGEH